MYPTVHARYYIGPECPSIKKSSVRTSPVSLMAIADAGIWSFCLVALAIFCCPGRLPAESFTHVFDFAPANPLVQRNRLALLGTLRLSIEAPDGKPLHGLSGLDWLPRTKLLYAASDQGYLVWLKPVFDGSYLRDVEFIGRFVTHPLQKTLLIHLALPALQVD